MVHVFRLRIKLCKVLYEEVKGLGRGVAQVLFASVVLIKFHGADVVCRAAGNPDGAHRDAGFRAGTGISCRGDGEIGAEKVYYSLHHFLCHLFAYGVLLLYKVGVDAKNIGLRLVGIADGAALVVC